MPNVSSGRANSAQNRNSHVSDERTLGGNGNDHGGIDHSGIDHSGIDQHGHHRNARDGQGPRRPIRRIASLAFHTSPLEQPGVGDAGGLNTYVLQTSKQLAAAGVRVDVFTRATSPDQPPTVEVAPGVYVRHIVAGPREPLGKEDLPAQLPAFIDGVLAASQHINRDRSIGNGRRRTESNPGEFDRTASHRTGPDTRQDDAGDDVGYDRSGYDSSGYNGAGYDGSGHDSARYDGSRYDGQGHHGQGHHGQVHDGQRYDGFGFDYPQYDSAEYDEHGYSGHGHDRLRYDSAGYNSAGHDRAGHDRAGYNRAGYDTAGFNGVGYDGLGYDGGYDLVHSHYWLSGQVGRSASLAWGVPLVHTAHTLGRVKNAARAAGERPEPTTRIRGEEWLATGADLLVANTEEEAANLIRGYEAQPARVRVVPPGVDCETFTPSSDIAQRIAERASFALPADRLIVSFVGRFQPLKAPDVLLRAVGELVAADRRWLDRLMVVLCGGASGAAGQTPRELGELAAQWGIASVVRFLPPQPTKRLAALYRASDLLAVPSFHESFGLVALEAQACGTPVLAAAVGGLTTAVREGVSGRLVHGHDPRTWANALADTLTDPGAMSAGAVAHARRFGWDSTVSGLLAAYDSISGRRTPTYQPKL